MSLVRGLLLHALAKLLYLGFAWSCTISPTLQIWPVRLRWKYGRNKAIFKNSLFIAHTSPRIVLLLGNFGPYFQHIFWLFEPREVLSSKSCQSTSQKAIADKHTRTIFPKNLRAGRPVGFVYFLVEQVSEFNSTDLKLTTFFFGWVTWSLDWSCDCRSVSDTLAVQCSIPEMRWSIPGGSLRKEFRLRWGQKIGHDWQELHQAKLETSCRRSTGFHQLLWQLWQETDRKLLLCAQVLVYFCEFHDRWW